MISNAFTFRFCALLGLDLGSLGLHLGSSWLALAAPWAPLGPPWPHLGAMLGLLGALLRALGSHLGASWPPPGLLLAASGSWGVPLGASSPFRDHFWAPVGGPMPLLGPCWDHFGTILGPFWVTAPSSLIHHLASHAAHQTTHHTPRTTDHRHKAQSTCLLHACLTIHPTPSPAECAGAP